jgi:hypothetical protein
MRLSQTQLNLLETCPRKFQHIYIDQLGATLPLEQQARLHWGSRFHLLMQQIDLGLPIAPFTSVDLELGQCVEAFLQTVPDLFEPQQGVRRQSEHRRTLEFQGYLLTVVYDLLVLDQQSAQIIDWKTYPRPQQSRWLAQDWQTRLYPFVLAETSAYEPEQISMTYWFVQGGDRQPSPSQAQPQKLEFRYSSTLHGQIRRDLTQRLQQLDLWLERYQFGEPFPQINLEAGRCENCYFAARCQRRCAPNASPETTQSLTLAEIQEVVL